MGWCYFFKSWIRKVGKSIAKTRFYLLLIKNCIINIWDGSVDGKQHVSGEGVKSKNNNYRRLKFCISRIPTKISSRFQLDSVSTRSVQKIPYKKIKNVKKNSRQCYFALFMPKKLTLKLAFFPTSARCGEARAFSFNGTPHSRPVFCHPLLCQFLCLKGIDVNCFASQNKGEGKEKHAVGMWHSCAVLPFCGEGGTRAHNGNQ